MENLDLSKIFFSNFNFIYNIREKNIKYINVQCFDLSNKKYILYEINY